MILAQPRLGDHQRLLRECRVPAVVSYTNQLWRTARHEAGHIVGGLDGGMVPVYASVGLDANQGAGGTEFQSYGMRNAPGIIAHMTMLLAAFYAENVGPFEYARLHHDGSWNSDAGALDEAWNNLPRRERKRAYRLAHLRAAGLMSRRRLDILRIAKQLMHKRVWRP